MNNLYSVIVENVVVETNNIFQVFALPVAVFNVFNLRVTQTVRDSIYFFHKCFLFMTDMSELLTKVLTLMSNFIVNEIYRRNL